MMCAKTGQLSILKENWRSKNMIPCFYYSKIIFLEKKLVLTLISKRYYDLKYIEKKLGTQKRDFFFLIIVSYVILIENKETRVSVFSRKSKFHTLGVEKKLKAVELKKKLFCILQKK